MSKARGASTARSVRRNSRKFRMFPNKPTTIKKSSGKKILLRWWKKVTNFIFGINTETGEEEIVTKNCLRRVFPNKEGIYPENAKVGYFQYGGFHPGNEPKYREVMYVIDTVLMKRTKVLSYKKRN